MIPPAVTILGAVTVSGRDRIVPLGGTNLPALMCVLAIAPGRAIANDRLIDALWPHADAVRGRRSLTSLVHQLNLILDPVLAGDRIIRTVKGVGRTLRMDPWSIDAVRFERGVAEGERHAMAGRHDAAANALIDALLLWRGVPFGGLDMPMLVEPAVQLQSSRARAETILFDSALRVGRAAELLDLLERKAQADPEDEQIVAALARALHQLGRRDDAFGVISDCIERLDRRGIEPTPPLRRLAAAIVERTVSAVESPALHPALRRRAKAQPELVGRHSERASIGNWFVGATAPKSVGRGLIIAGEPGIGKTAVLDAWLHGMTGSAMGGMVFIRSRCSPEQILPFEAFASLLASDRSVESADPSDESHDRKHLFDRVADRLQAMDVDQPVLLAIDDAHWMTPSSVALLEYLVTSDRLGRVRFVLTLRHHELRANEPLRRLVAEWQTARRIETLTLGPLSDPEIELLATRHVPAQHDRSAAVFQPGGLRALTGGNPLFVIQVAQAATRGPAVPATVERLLGRYLDGLASGQRRAVETAALIGMVGSLERVARCTGRTELDEIDALDSVGGGRLLHVSPIDGSYRFVHELARHTVTQQIPPGRAMRLHLTIADGLSLEREPDVFAIAHHLRLAGPVASPDRAADAMLSAARLAREFGDFETSKALAAHALRTTDVSAVQADALVLMASGAQSLGDREAAAEHISSAVALALESNATAVLARALFVKSAVMCFWGNDDLVERVEQSSGWLRDDGASVADGTDIVEVIWAMCLDRPAHALLARQSLAARALRAARASDNALAILQALHASQLVGQMMLTDPDTVLSWCDEGLDLARSTGHLMMFSLITSQKITALMRAGRVSQAQAVLEQMISAGQQVPDLALRWANIGRRASLALVTDDLATAERLIAEARGVGEPLAGSRPAEEYINHMGVLHLANGSLPGLHHLFGAWVDQPPSSVWHWAVASGELIDPLDPGAIERLETLAANAGSPLPPHSEWLPELTIAAEFASRSGDHELGKIVARCIEPFVHHHAVFGLALSLGSMWRPYALALAASGDDRSAREAMATARLVNAGAGLSLWERLSRLG